jgi:signal peptidase I
MANNPEKALKRSDKSLKQKSIAREYIEAIIFALIIALLIRSFIVQAFKIPSGSMKNTLLIGDHILVSKFAYGIHIPNEIPFTNIKLFPDIRLLPKNPGRGDVIVFKFPKDETRDFIKRVVGIPGDKIQLVRQKLYVNDKLVDEPYIIHLDPAAQGSQPISPRDDLGPILVPPGHLFMMGDNRENSQDSRFWGFLDINKVKGRAFVIYWSWDRENNWFRSERLGRGLQDDTPIAAIKAGG